MARLKMLGCSHAVASGLERYAWGGYDGLVFNYIPRIGVPNLSLAARFAVCLLLGQLVQTAKISTSK
jgi:hypothetical protein